MTSLYVNIVNHLEGVSLANKDAHDSVSLQSSSEGIEVNLCAITELLLVTEALQCS